MLFCDQHVERRHNEQSKNRSDGHATDEHKTDRVSRRCASASNECQRKVTGDGRDARHHDRAQTNAGRLRDGGKFR